MTNSSTPPDPRARHYTIPATGHASPVQAAALAPGLHITATPIGNLGDITLRALNALAGAGYILCEDTRMTARLLQRYAIFTTMKVYHDHNGARLRPQVLADLKAGAAIVLVSDAGTPLVSDPGFKLVREVIKAGLDVHMYPGASAPLMALALSGLPSDRFQFCGFLPPRQGKRRASLRELRDIKATLIFFESPKRIAASLDDVAATLGNRHIAVARELTKRHEQVLRGTLDQVRAQIAGGPALRGEITLVIGPPQDSGAGALTQDDIDSAIYTALQDHSPSRAAAHVAAGLGLPKRDIYQRTVALARSGER